MPLSLPALALTAALTAALAAAGDEVHTVDVAGAARTYKIHVPAELGSDVRAPLVVVLHGGGGNADAIAENSGMSPKADREKFIVAYPQGVGRQAGAYTWNASHCCAFAMTEHAPDVEFIGKLLDDIERLHRVDSKKIYITGMSNGGMMAYRILGAMADRIAAAGIVAGAMFADQPKPSRPVAMVMFHGSADPVVPFNGGTSPNATVAQSMNAPFLPVKSAFDFWSKQDGCQGEISETTTAAFTKQSQESCRAGAAVILYVIHDGGHAWPGGLRGATGTPAISATDVMWTFFAAHAQP